MHAVLHSLGSWIWRHRWLWIVLLTALIVRLHWNLYLHPIGDYITSDMFGYNHRANQMLDDFERKIEYHTFFPYGTHWLAYFIKLLFGRENFTAIAIIYALLGTGVVGFSYGIASRISSRQWFAPFIGLLLAFYYPLISLGGYLLSEIPFAFWLTGATFFLIRMVQMGRLQDAFYAGIFTAIGAVFRPQILLSVALFGLFWLVFRKRLFKVKFHHLLVAITPVLLILILSSIRFYHHTNRFGLISENGTFNLVFGRCHCKKIIARAKPPKKGFTHFGPPPLIQLSQQKQRDPDSWVQLDPAIGPELDYQGYIGDKQVLHAFLRQCVQKTGFLGQVKYSITNVILLVGYNTMWPDSGRKEWRPVSAQWGKAYLWFVMPPALLALFIFFRPRYVDRHGILAVHEWALVCTAAIIFGDVRMRIPYDPFILILAAEVYLLLACKVWKWGLDLGAKNKPKSMNI